MHSIVRSAAAWLLCVACLCGPALGQEQDDDEPDLLGDSDVEQLQSPPTLTRAEARRILSEPLPGDAAAAYALLERQEAAARLLGARARHLELLYQLIELARPRGQLARWVLTWAESEFQHGSQGKSVEKSEQLLSDPGMAITTRALLALRQAFFLCQLGRLEQAWRSYSRADGWVTQALATELSQTEKARLKVYRLQARSEIERTRGELEESLASLREGVALGREESRRLLARSPQLTSADPELRSSLLLTQAALGPLVFALQRLSRHTEAIAVANEGLRMSEADSLGKPVVQHWYFRLAHSHLGNRQYEEALAWSTRSETLASQLGASLASHSAWMARRGRILALIGLQRWAEADDAYQAFLRDMPADSMAASRAADLHLDSLLAAKNGRSSAALQTIERRVRYRERLFGPDHPLTRESRGVRGLVHLLSGNWQQALPDYESLFVATLDKPSGWVDLGTTGVRGYVLAVAFDEFLRAVALASGKGDSQDARVIDRSMQVADYLSLTVTHEALTDSASRYLARSPKLAEMLLQEQQQRRRLRDQYRELSTTMTQGAAAGASDPSASRPGDKARAERRERISRQRASIEAEQAKLAALREGIAKQDPAYADLVTPPVASVATLKRTLSDDEAVLVVYPTPRSTLVWAIGQGGRTGFHVAPIESAELSALVARLRSSLDLSTTFGAQVPEFKGKELFDLYKLLVQPLESSLKGAQSLIVVAQGALGAIPFGTLLTAPPEPGKAASAAAWLVRRHAVSHLPSVSSLLALRRAQAAPAAQPLAAFGDPIFDAGGSSPPVRPVRALAVAKARQATSFDATTGFRYAAMPPLPETRAELLAVARALRAPAEGNVFLGAEATRRRVLQMDLSDRRVVAFATHGLMPGELPGVSKPALALSVSADPADSPLLNLDDVLGLKLNAQWVVLSACNTTAAELGGPALSGLVRGFFHAGARSVLATHWAVETESAAALVAASFESQFKNTAPTRRATALQAAQIAMIDGKLGSTQWSHPFFWAAFALFGDPAR